MSFDRHAAIIRLLQQPEGATLSELSSRLPHPPSQRTLTHDLAVLRQRFPERMVAERRGRSLAWRILGQQTHVLPTPLTSLDDDQVTALIAARGILRLPAPDGPAHEQPQQAYHGVLAQALDRLLHEAGLHEEAGRLAPDDLCISRFGIAAEDPAIFPSVLDALRAGESVRATYTTLEGRSEAIHVRPVRLVSIAGEWHLFAWATDQKRPPGRIKQYRLARMTAVVRAATNPPGCPSTGLRREVTAILADAFRATGSSERGHRVRVRLGLSPLAKMFVEQRRWGADQQLQPGPHPGLPPDWWQLTFVTTGLKECRHWVLGFGAEVTALEPHELHTWITDQAQRLLASPHKP